MVVGMSIADAMTSNSDSNPFSSQDSTNPFLFAEEDAAISNDKTSTNPFENLRQNPFEFSPTVYSNNKQDATSWISFIDNSKTSSSLPHSQHDNQIHKPFSNNSYGSYSSILRMPSQSIETISRLNPDELSASSPSTNSNLLVSSPVPIDDSILLPASSISFSPMRSPITHLDHSSSLPAKPIRNLTIDSSRSLSPRRDSSTNANSGRSSPSGVSISASLPSSVSVLPLSAAKSSLSTGVKLVLNEAPPLPARPVRTQSVTDSNYSRNNYNSSTNPYIFASNGHSSSMPSSPSTSPLGLRSKPTVIEKDTLHTPLSDSANMRPPLLDLGAVEVIHKGPIRCFAVSGTTLCTGSSNFRVWNIANGENTKTNPLGDAKVVAMAFVPTRHPSDEGRFVFVSVDNLGRQSEKGELLCLDVKTGEIVERRVAHQATVTHILRNNTKTQLWTIDENGGLKIWPEDKQGPTGVVSLITSKPTSLRISSRQHLAHLTNNCLLWTASAKTIESYNPNYELSNLPFQKRFDAGSNVGNITGLTSTSLPQYVFSSHDDGKIVIWDNLPEKTGRLRVINAGMYKMTSIQGVGDRFLWTGHSTGKIAVYDFGDNAVKSSWTEIKEWEAYHHTSVENLALDEATYLESGKLHVVSISEAGSMKLWDGLLAKDYYNQAMTARESEFSTTSPIRFFVGSWNLDAAKPDALEGRRQDMLFLSEWLTTVNKPDMIVIGLQEIIDLESTKANAKKFFQGSKRANEHQDRDHRFVLWQKQLITAVRQYIPDVKYSLVQCNVMVGLFQAVFVADAHVSRLRDLEVKLVKTGLGGVYGNKGAIAARFIFDDSSICFVNCHLSAHVANLASRNADIINIMNLCQFQAKGFYDNIWVHGGDGSRIMDHDFVIWAGDLNFRIDGLHRDRVVQLVEKRQWDVLYEYDQLLRQKATPSFPLRAFIEGNLDFAPTFKYDRGSVMYDTSDKKRVPAWCDRILYKTSEASAVYTKLSQTSYRRYECLVSDHRPIGSGFEASIKKLDMSRRAEVAHQIRKKSERYLNRMLMMVREDWLTSICGNRAVARQALMQSKSLKIARDIVTPILPVQIQ